MSLVIDWDVVSGASVTKSAQGLEIIRPVCVTGIGSACVDGQNPDALLKALTVVGLPVEGTPYSATYPYALLEDYRVRTIDSDDSVMVDLIYRQQGPGSGDPHGSSTWSVTDSEQSSHIQTYATANGTANTLVWYKSGASSSQNVPPAKSATRVPPLPKIITYRTIKASGILRGTDWATFKPQVRAAAGRINSDTWGSATRGTWLFLGPSTRWYDRFKRVIYVDLNFINDPDGWYPLSVYLNPHGAHPADCVTEAALRATGLPVADQNKTRNGISITSIYKEATFSDKFIFTPDD